MKKILALILAVLFVFAPLSSAFAAAEAPLPFENSAFHQVGDYSLHYRIYPALKEEKGRIMLIHGFCLSTVSFEPLAEIYAENGYTTVTVDIPNFGYSTRENSDMKLLDREEVIFSLMEKLGGTWIAGGHSMGGGIAINLATDYPETVKGLLLFAPQTSAEGKPQGRLSTALMQIMMETVRSVIIKIPCVVRNVLVAGSFSSMEFAKDYPVEKIITPFEIKGTGAGIVIMSSHTRGSDLEKLSKLNIPCVIITARKDMVANADNLAEIIENAPQGTKVVNFEEGGHMMMEFDPQKTAAETLDIISAA